MKTKKMLSKKKTIKKKLAKIVKSIKHRKKKAKKKNPMNTFVVFVRRSRKSKWKQTEMTVTSFSSDIAREIAASKNKDKWVRVQIKRK